MDVSIYDVAKLAGVSISTVSRVMNKSGYASKQTEMKVKQAMATLGFVPSITAQNLAKHQTMLIGLYFSHFVHPINGLTSNHFMEFIRGANEMVMEKGYHLLLINEPHHNDELLSGGYLPQYTTFWRQKRVDGLVFGTAPLNISSFFELVDSETPMVYIGERLVSDRGLNVYAQYKHNVWKSLDYLYERNHRDLIVFNFEDPHVLSFVSQYKRWKNDPELKVQVRPSGDDLDSYMEVLSDTFMRSENPTGILILDLSKVQTTINYLNNTGLRVPEDVSIVTQEHHYKGGEQCHPAVTSVYVPMYEMAVKSVELLFDYLEGREIYNKQILLSPKLIERQSVATRK